MYLEATFFNGIAMRNAEFRLAFNRDIYRLIASGEIEPRIQVVSDSDQLVWHLVEGVPRAAPVFVLDPETHVKYRIPFLWLAPARPRSH